MVNVESSSGTTMCGIGGDATVATTVSVDITMYERPCSAGRGSSTGSVPATAAVATRKYVLVEVTEAQLDADVAERVAAEADDKSDPWAPTTLESQLAASIEPQARACGIEAPGMYTVLGVLSVVRWMLRPGEGSAEMMPSTLGFDGNVLYRVLS